MPTTRKRIRRVAPRRRTARSRSRKRPVVHRHLATMLNAAYPNAQPKIPDGTSVPSLGRKYVATKEIQTNQDGVTTIVLYPGFSACAFAYNAFPELNAERVFNYQAYTSPLLNAFSDAVGKITIQQADDKVVKWRGVSFGLRVMVTNSSEQNDGWWEAINVPCPESCNEYYVRKQVDDLRVENALTPATVVAFPIQSHIGNLAEHPTYRTGKLRNIHNTLFQCQTTSNVHPHVDMVESYVWNYDQTVVEQGYPVKMGAAIGRINTGDAQNNLACNQLFDRNFGCLILRLHGRKAAGDGTGSTRFAVTTYANVEQTYDESSKLAIFQTTERGSDPITFPVSKSCMLRIYCIIFINLMCSRLQVII